MSSTTNQAIQSLISSDEIAFDNQFVFIDSAVENCESLMAGLKPGITGIILDRAQNALEKISQILASRRGVRGIHIVSHGSAGCLQLGFQSLTLNNLDSYANLLQQWTSTGEKKPDIFLYGCHVAAGDIGKAFVQRFSQITGANIAASANKIGSSAKGGDWNLEVRIGEIKTTLAFQPAVLKNYQGVFNNDPILLNSISDQITVKYAPFNFSIHDTFFDADGEQLTYQATLDNGSNLPNWLSFDSTNHTLSGTPGILDTGTFGIKVTAEDSSGISVSDIFNLTVINQAPTVVNAIADITIKKGVPFSLNFNNVFGDADNEQFHYTATQENGNPLPYWLNSDLSGNLYGTPNTWDVGTFSIKVNAEDSPYSSVSDVFNLTIVDSAPTLVNAIADRSTKKGAPFSFSINNHFIDADGDGIIYSATLEDGSPLPSWLNFYSYGTFSGTPTNGEVGTISIKVTAKSSPVNSVSDTFNLTVTNSAPTSFNATPDQLIVPETPFNLYIGNAFSDADNESLDYSVTLENGNPLPTWLNFDPATLSFSGTPSNSEIGIFSIKITASDSSFSSVSDIFNLTIADSAPTLANPIADQIIRKNAPFNFSIGSAFINAANYTATLANANPLPSWLSFDSNSGSFIGTPSNVDVGTVGIKVSALDALGNPVSDTFNLTVINNAPTVFNPIADFSTRKGSPFNFSIGNAFNDVNNDPLYYHATLANGNPLPSGMWFDSNSGTFNGTLSNADVGTFSIKVTASDSPYPEFGANTVSDIFDLTVTDSEPTVVKAIADFSTNKGAPFNFSIKNAFNDAENDPLFYYATLANGAPLPAWLNFDYNTATFSGMPSNFDVGTLSIKVSAESLPYYFNVGANKVSDIFNLTVTNSDPILLNAIGDRITQTSAPFNFSIRNAFYDRDGEALQYTATLANGNPLPSWLSFDSANGTFTGTPENFDAGTLSIEVTASDSLNSRVSDIFKLTMTNSAPTVVNATPDQIATESTPFSLTLADNIFSDPEGDPLQYSVTLDNGNDLPLWLSFNSLTKTFFGTPNSANIGTIGIKIIASDSPNSVVSDNFYLTVNSSNPPTLANAIADQTTAKGAGFFLNVASAFTNATNYSLTLANGNSLPSWLNFNSTNNYLYGTPTNANVGTVAIQVNALDEFSNPVTDIFNLTVINNAPTVVNATPDQIVAKNDSFYLDIGNAFSDVNNDTLYYSATLANGDPLPGWLTFDSVNHRFYGTPSYPDVDSIDITVTASDSPIIGDRVSDTFNLKITNSEPIVANAIADQTTPKNAAFSFTIADNTFTDADSGDPLYYRAILANGNPLPSWLNFDSVSGTFSGTPSHADVGAINIKVIASDYYADPGDISDIFTLNVTNGAPVVTNAIADQTLTKNPYFNPFDFNISNAFSDPENDPLYYNATLANGNSLPSWLWFDSNSGTFHSSTSNRDVGTISIKVTASESSDPTKRDANFVSDIFNLTVNNNAPILDNSTPDQTILSQTFFNLSIADNFSDADSDTLYYQATLANRDPLPNWLYFDSNNGTFSGVPSHGDVGSLGITVTASDSNFYTNQGSDRVSDTFILTVDPNPLPTLINNQSLLLNESATSAITSSQLLVQDGEGDPITYTVTALPSSGTLLLNNTPISLNGTFAQADINAGAIAYTHSGSETFSDSFSFTATDGSDGSISETTFAITINPVNDAPTDINIDSTSIAENSANGTPIGTFNAIDPETNDTHTYSLIDNAGGRFAINGNQLIVGDGSLLDYETISSYSIRVRTTDSANPSASFEKNFNISIDNVNEAPILANAISDRAATENAAFSFQFADNIFIDADAGDSLTYTATKSDDNALPNWLSFNASDRTFSGTPAQGDVGTLSIKVQATDSAGAIASDIFNLSVNAIPIEDTDNPDNDTLTGNSDNDTPTGSTDNDTLTGNSDNDTPTGNSDNDTLIGNSDSDTPTGNSDSDTLTGNSDSDTLIGNSDNDTLTGNSDNDTPTGNSDNDTPTGNSDNDTPTGNSDSDTPTGNSDNDTLTGNSDSDTPTGNSDNDTLTGNSDSDTPTGNSDSDTPTGNSDNDTLTGNSDNDTLTGNSDNDTLTGNSDSDTPTGNSDNDTLTGNSDNDTLTGNSDNDTLTGNSDSDTSTGNSDNDTLTGNSDSDTPTGNSDNDTLIGNSDSDTPTGNSDNDTLIGNSDNDTLTDNSDRDTLTGNDNTTGNNNTTGSNSNDNTTGSNNSSTSSNGILITGTDRSDTLTGGNGNDTVTGDRADDILSGKQRQDNLQGEDGNDWLFGNQGADTLDGGDGDDILFGGKDDDLLLGKAGNDILCGDKGNDSLNGGDNNDMLFGNRGADTLDGGDGDDILFGGKDDDLLLGKAGNDILCGDKGNDSLDGGDGNDMLFGNKGADNLDGGSGSDTLHGGKQGDRLIGGAGDDLLSGDIGNDTVTGGVGSDRFLFTPHSGSDIITDFENGIDRIALSGGLTFEKLNITSGNNATLIKIASTDKLLASLHGVQSNLIGSEDFAFI